MSLAAAASKATLLLELERMLRERRARGEITGARSSTRRRACSDELLEEIRLLANIETSDREAAAGGPRRPARARRPSERDRLRQLNSASRCAASSRR